MDYLDNENDPQFKNPQFKRNIADIIGKIQQKPKIEPASTKALNLLMATRRKELEEKQKREEEKLLEDKLRKEKQDKLKERVTHSKALVDNRKQLQKRKQEKIDIFKQNVKNDRESYQEKLAISLQRIYNQPLMFEQVTGKHDKFEYDREIQEKLEE